MELNSELDRAKQNLQQFAELVAEMRLYQKKYFRYRAPDDLRRAKNAEKQVDAAVERFTGSTDAIHRVSEQHPKLF